MKRRHVLASMGAFTASGSAIISSGAFTSVEVEREVNIDVVGDEEAFLGLIFDDITIDRSDIDIGGTVAPVVEGKTPHEESLVELLNQFGVDITVDEFDIEVESDDDVDVELSEDPNGGDSSCDAVGDPTGEDIDRGECLDVRIDVRCPIRGQDTSATVSFDIAVSGDGVSAETTESRVVEVTCEGISEIDPIEEGVRFMGSGNALLLSDDIINETVTVWYIDDGILGEENQTLGSTLIRPQSVTHANNPIAAVHFGGKTYFHQNLEQHVDDDSETYSIGGGSGSNQPTKRVCNGKVDLKGNPSRFGCWNDD